MSKGFDDFDRLVYPPLVQDLPFMIPEMASVVEVIPYTRNIDLFQDTAQLGWNLFVLGSQRQYLGETHHYNLQELAMQITQGQILSEDRQATHQVTPRSIIHFVTRILGSHQGGHLNLTPRTNQFANQFQMTGLNGGTSSFFSQRRSQL